MPPVALECARARRHQRIHRPPILLALVGCLLIGAVTRALAADSPDVYGFRGGSRRQGLVAPSLALPLAKVWEASTAAPQPAWPERSPKLSFDWWPVPVTDGQRVYLSSSARGAVDAWDLRTGKRLWTCYADGPVRFAPLVVENRLYFVADDGYLYCVDASTGREIWRRQGAPAGRIVLGNEHYISAWPARGAPVYHNGVVYFAAGIWPWMGIFIHAVDATTGEIVWTNSGEGEKYLRQQHNSPAFAGIAPQGYLATDGKTLLVPGGLTVPGLFDIQTGRALHFDPSSRTLGKSAGGYDVMVGSDYYINRGGLYDLKTGRPLSALAADLITGDAAYGIDGNHLICFENRLGRTKRKVRDRRGRTKEETISTLPRRWRVTLEGAEPRLLGMAGPLFVVARDNQIELLERTGEQLKTRWQYDLGEPVGACAIGNDVLVVSTRRGRLLAFGARGSSAALPDGPLHPSQALKAPPAASIPAALHDSTPGFGMIFGVPDEKSLAQLVSRTRLNWTIFVDSRTDADALRRRLDASDLLGARCSVRVWYSEERLPPYTARHVVVTKAFSEDRDARMSQIVSAVRPYGGRLWVESGDDRRWSDAVRGLAGEEWGSRSEDDWQVFLRPGPLPGAGTWTHQTGNAANTLVSLERRVELPLGILWYGGPSNRDVLPRHGHGPSPQVVQGRAIIEGPDMLRAIDAYSGVLLWQTEFPGIGAFYNTTSHHPGAGAIGGNYATAPDAIYVLYRRACHVLDPETGRVRARWTLPADSHGQPPHWGWLAWVDDVLLAAAEPVAPLTRNPSGAADDESVAYAEGSRWLYALDRKTGKVLWKRKAVWNFRHNAIAAGGGRVYCVDGMTAARRRFLARRGQPADNSATLYALDLHTGQPIWSRTEGIFGTWLAYHPERNVLLEAGSRNRDRAKDEAGRGMTLYDAATGSVLWHHDQTYAGPPLLFADRIVTQGAAFDLETGQAWKRRDPLTGETVDWFFRKNYGCDTAIGCPNLLTFRSAAAGFYDLAADGGTGNFGGFRTSCTATLIPADGLIVSPDYTRTCVCSYQQRTSLALVPMPEIPYWTFLGARRWSGRRIERLGVNLGAPGDRRDQDGTLWLEHPMVGGDSPQVPIHLEGEPLRTIRHHPLLVAGEFDWVASSGMAGIRRLTVPLVGDDVPSDGPVPYRVELWFAELEGAKRGERTFDVWIGDRKERAALDIVAATGGPMRSLHLDLGVHMLDKSLAIRFKPTPAAKRPPILCGVRIRRVADRPSSGR